MIEIKVTIIEKNGTEMTMGIEPINTNRTEAEVEMSNFIIEGIQERIQHVQESTKPADGSPNKNAEHHGKQGTNEGDKVQGMIEEAREAQQNNLK